LCAPVVALVVLVLCCVAPVELPLAAKVALIAKAVAPAPTPTKRTKSSTDRSENPLDDQG